MVAEQKLQIHLPRMANSFGICSDHHAVPCLNHACSDQRLEAVSLDHAHTASAILVNTFQVTEAWNMYIAFVYCLKYSLTFYGINGFAININNYFLSHLKSLLTFCHSAGIG